MATSRRELPGGRHSSFQAASSSKTRQLPPGLVTQKPPRLQPKGPGEDLSHADKNRTGSLSPPRQRAFPPPKAKEERERGQTLHGTQLGSQWTQAEESGGNYSKFGLLQNESFQVLRQSKHISSDYGENDDYDGDSGRVPMAQ